MFFCSKVITILLFRQKSKQHMKCFSHTLLWCLNFFSTHFFKNYLLGADSVKILEGPWSLVRVMVHQLVQNKETKLGLKV